MRDEATEGVWSDLRSGEDRLLNAEAIKEGKSWGFAVGQRSDLTNGVDEFLRGDLATLAFIGSALVLHDGDAVLLEARVPGLDGAPGKLARVAILVGEGHGADRFDPGLDGIAEGHVDGTKDAHFEIGCGVSHECSDVGFIELTPTSCR